MAHYDDVKAFHQKFELATDETEPRPHLLDVSTTDYRAEFLQEELDEFVDACDEGNLDKATDALLDIVYVAYGTALMMGVSPACWNELWAEVQRANMSKERATSAGDERSKRSNSLDVVKPVGWRGPNGGEILARYGAEE